MSRIGFSTCIVRGSACHQVFQLFRIIMQWLASLNWNKLIYYLYETCPYKQIYLYETQALPLSTSTKQSDWEKVREWILTVRLSLNSCMMSVLSLYESSLSVSSSAMASSKAYTTTKTSQSKADNRQWLQKDQMKRLQWMFTGNTCLVAELRELA